MSDPVLNALRRNRAIAEAAGQTERVARMDARLAALGEASEAVGVPVPEEPRRSRGRKKVIEAEVVPADEPVDFDAVPEPEEAE